MPTYTRPISAHLLASGLVGTLGYTIRSASGITLVARTTSGIAEDGASAIYSAIVASWDTSWAGSIAWDAGAGTLAREDFLPYAPQGGDSFARPGPPSAQAIADAVAGRLSTDHGPGPWTAPATVTIADGSINSSKFAVATVDAGATGLLERLMLLVARFFPAVGGSMTAPRSGNGNAVLTGAGGTPISTQAVTDDGVTQTLGGAS